MNHHDKTPWNPSRKAIARVKDPQPVPTRCECGGNVSILHHEAIYRGRVYGDWPWMYVCDECGARVGMHPFTAIPLGTLANAELRAARSSCKPAFERLWQNHGWKRDIAYAWLAQQLGIELAKCHFGLFDIATCERAKAICEKAVKS